MVITSHNGYSLFVAESAKMRPPSLMEGKAGCVSSYLLHLQLS